jgi:hypothetical protein
MLRVISSIYHIRIAVLEGSIDFQLIKASCFDSAKS